jgi:hypothetical protein
MAFKELESPIPEVLPEDQPDLMAYSLLQNFVADLTPRGTSDGMELWRELRYRATGEVNHPRWSQRVYVDGEIHTVGLYGVYGERPDGTSYDYNALRCSCSLPDHKSFVDLNSEYHSCPAKDFVIAERVKVYRELMGAKELGEISHGTLSKMTILLLEMIAKDRLAWPPSDRSDRVLIDPIAEVYDVSKPKMRQVVEELAEDKVVQIHGHTHPSLSLAA